MTRARSEDFSSVRLRFFVWRPEKKTSIDDKQVSTLEFQKWRMLTLPVLDSVVNIMPSDRIPRPHSRVCAILSW